MASSSAGARRTKPGVMLTCFAIILYVFILLPSLLTIPISFGGGSLSFPPQSLSLELFRRFFRSPVWTESLTESVLVGILTGIIAVLFGSLSAYGLARGRFPGRRALNVLLLSPVLIPSIVVALGVYFYFSTLGLVGTTMGLVLAHSILTMPYVIVMLTASLKQIDPNVERAAAIAGASPWRIFRSVVLPQIRFSIIASFFFAFLISFDEVVISWFISGTGATTLPVVMYSSLKVEVAPEIAAAATLLSGTSIVVIAVVVVFGKLRNAPIT